MRDTDTAVHFWTGGPQPWPESAHLIAARDILAGKVAIRESFLPGLIHDPAVEIMLLVFIAESTDDAVRYEDIPEAIGVAATVAWRWVAVLAQRGLVEVISGSDGSMVEVTAQGLATTARAISAVIARQAQQRR